MGVLEIVRAVCALVPLGYACYCDVKSREIPNWTIATVAVLAVLGFNPSQLLGIFPAAIVFMVAWATNKIGGGDIKLVAAISVLLGLDGSIILLFVMSLSMLIFYYAFAVFCKATKRALPSEQMPLVPYISLGYIAANIVLM